MSNIGTLAGNIHMATTMAMVEIGGRYTDHMRDGSFHVCRGQPEETWARGARISDVIGTARLPEGDG